MPFKKGQGGRKEGAKNKTRSDVRELIDSCVTDEDWILIFQKFAEKAKLGDDKSGKLLMEYKFGKPVQEIATPPDQPIEHNHTVTASPSLLDLANKFAKR